MVAGLASFFPVRNSCSVGVWVWIACSSSLAICALPELIGNTALTSRDQARSAKPGLREKLMRIRASFDHPLPCRDAERTAERPTHHDVHCSAPRLMHRSAR